ncbi:hypothetical protein GCM10022207_89040 [Streptomyces lannensis]|uniref:Uncharacterized protein n=1 Tax=Streptomyces lannensis TaxID=766498 RepID=A0ABP7LR57_9ACTN
MTAKQGKDDRGAVPITVTLPGGQEIRARLHARRQTKDGWQYQVGVLIWQDTADGGVEAVEHRAWVSPAHARPVPGISYDHVPTSRASQIGSTAPCTGQPAWTVQHLPHRPGHPGATLIHVVGCTPSAQTLDREQALTALRQPRAAACRECGAAGSLADHDESPDKEAEAPTFPRVPG